MKDTAKRRYELDWLRILAVLLLIYFHTAAIFYKGDLGQFYVLNAVTSPAIAIFILFVHQWHMPLFFFLSGAATWFSLESRSASEYISERFQRLFIPFVFGTLILVPPQVYCRLLQQEYQGTLFQFYPQFFHGIRPAGNFEWAHLWFIVYLFVFSLVALPIFLVLKRDAGRRWCAALADRVARSPLTLFLPALLLALIEALLRPRWIGFQNLYDDWANVALYLAYFGCGYLFCSDARFGQVLDRARTWAIVLAITAMFVLVGLWISDRVPDRSYSLSYMTYQAFRGFNTWCWILALLSLARVFLNFSNWVLRYLTEAAYPFYMLHQTVVVTIGFYVVQWQTGVLAKFIVISTASLIGTIGLYDLLVRRINITRFCLGLKPIPPQPMITQ